MLSDIIPAVWGSGGRPANVESWRLGRPRPARRTPNLDGFRSAPDAKTIGKLSLSIGQEHCRTSLTYSLSFAARNDLLRLPLFQDVDTVRVLEFLSGFDGFWAFSFCFRLPSNIPDLRNHFGSPLSACAGALPSPALVPNLVLRRGHGRARRQKPLKQVHHGTSFSVERS